LLEDPTISFFADGTTPHVAAVAKRTVDARLGNDEASWQWGHIHRAHWYHPLGDVAFGIGPREVDGGSHTLRNTGAELPPHAASSGAEYRIVVDFAAPDSFLAVQNIGNSGVPGSPHYQDQFEPWLRGEYHVVQLRRKRVEADCKSSTVIQPG
jgi:penicillin amidase